jgi:hypothetical protein
LRHGWTVSGPLQINSDGTTGKIPFNRVSIREVETVKETFKPEAVLRMFELDFNDRTICSFPEELGHSQEDLKFLKQVEQGIKQVDGPRHDELLWGFK